MAMKRFLSILKHRRRENDRERRARLLNIIVGGLVILNLLILIGRGTICNRNHRHHRAGAALVRRFSSSSFLDAEVMCRSQKQTWGVLLIP
jgi:hypothetical protein